ncbi:MAG: di-trans,poly-cis-decaprenylcistransferase [Burkholderiales bacterium]|jgi:undecaprenyl diphosphate synthase|nr:di-trans,poly-cis-decaprenylcistransferase [Burkholderiales bacterium]
MQRLHTGVPRHVAIIMDGNGRWATARHLPRMAGHNRGMESVRAVLETCGRRGIEYLTLFAFSSENWHRPADEVSTLMRLFVTALQREVVKLVENDVRLRVVGERNTLDPELQRLIVESEERTAGNSRLQLTLCVSYGGRWDIVQAAQTVVREQGVEALDEAALGQRLALAFAPEPDLLIRTGGEQRISNFLLWQCAYAELYFTHALWPDFSAAAFDEALAWYAQRERRFGRTSQQLAANS